MEQDTAEQISKAAQEQAEQKMYCYVVRDEVETQMGCHLLQAGPPCRNFTGFSTNQMEMCNAVAYAQGVSGSGVNTTADIAKEHGSAVVQVENAPWERS